MIICLMLMTCIGAFAERVPQETVYVDVLASEMEAIAPAIAENGRIEVCYRDQPQGSGGAKLTFESPIDGFKKIKISYDHAHMTGAPVKMRYYLNAADTSFEGTYLEAHNIANGIWGRYTQTTTYIPVKKGTNTFRLASVQDSGTWQFYVDKISYSKDTYATKADIPKEFIDVPAPKDILDWMEMELLDNNIDVVISDTTDTEGYKQIRVKNPVKLLYSGLDFGASNITSLTIRHYNYSSIPYIRIWLDDQVLAEGNLKHYSHYDYWTETTFYFDAINGKHNVAIEHVYGTVDLNRMQFGTKKEEQKTQKQTRDVMSDTWVAMDDLGRFSPTAADVKTYSTNKKVGIFYFVWHTFKNRELFDHTAAYNAGGAEAVWDMIPQGPLGYQHYWSEPYFGYYRSEDDWIIRKHARMLVNSGIDFIFLDNSNDLCYPGILQKIFDVWSEIRSEGGTTPQIAFLFGFDEGRTQRQTTNVYHYFIKGGQYDDLLFKWNGKPLILGDSSEIKDKEIKSAFTFRSSWAFNDWTGDGKEKWPWIAEYPQNPGANRQGLAEQVTVACGFHANSSRGRSYTTANGQPTDGKNAFEFELESTPWGLGYTEQWSRAYEVNPPLVMLTGWNEWWAGRWQDDGAGQNVANTYICDPEDEVKRHLYVDNFNTEFSRDLEPENGKLGDNYYQQTVQKIRQYKGVRDIPTASGAKDIDLAASFAQWEGILPVYYDHLNDTTHRNEPANAGSAVYVNETGRNDIDTAKVSLFGDAVSFYVCTKESFVGTDTETFMNLFINSDGDYTTGWYGYDYLVNRSRDGKTLSVEKHQDGWNWQKVADAPYTMSEKELQVKIPLSVLGMRGDVSYFDFKWADNAITDGTVMHFYDKGDSAPDDRFNYRWRKAQDGFSAEESYAISSKTLLAMKENETVAYLGTNTMDVTDNQAINLHGKTMVPLRFAAETLGLSVTWNEKRHTAFIMDESIYYSITLGDTMELKCGGETMAITVAPQLVGNRLYIAAEDFAKAFGFSCATGAGEVLLGEDTENAVSPFKNR